jgi:hypothetical protein
MRRPALGELRADAPVAQPVAMGLRIVAAVALHELGSARGSAWSPAEGGMASTNGRSCVTS